MMINFLLWLIAGAIIGWAAGLVMRDQNGLAVNIVVGIVGAMIGGLLLGGPTINESAFNLSAMVVSFIGAIILLGLVHLVRRGRVT